MQSAVVRVSTLAVLVAVGAAALVPAASARDAKLVASTATTFDAGGLRATWSDAKGTAALDPGKRFTVRVRATKKAARSARARITAARTAGDAGPKRVVLRRTLRSGTVHLRVAKAPGTTYRVEVRIGKRVRTVWVVVNGPTPPDVVPAPAPAPVCDPNAGSLGAPVGATTPGIVPISIANQSGFPLLHGGSVIWERQEGAVWVTAPFPPNYAVPAVLMSTEPGVLTPRIVSVWTTLTTSTYRMALPVRCADSGVEGVLYSGPVAVTKRELAPTSGFVAVPAA